MTVSNTVAKSGPYIATGPTGTFPRTFKALRDNHVVVLRERDGIETELTLGIGHTGIGDATGSVVISTGIQQGDRIVLIRRVPVMQDSAYSSQGSVSPEQIERDIDKVVMIAQDLSERAARTLTLPATSSMTGAEAVAAALAAPAYATQARDAAVEAQQANASKVAKQAQYLLADLTRTIDPGPFGGKFLNARAAQAQKLDMSDDAADAPRFAQALSITVNGGHLNGPGAQRSGLWLLAQKADFLTSAKTGEIDGAYIVVRQGRSGDAGGILIDAAKVVVPGSPDGGLTPMEIAGQTIDMTGATIRRVHAIPAFMEAKVAGAFTNGNGSGLYLEARAGAIDSGIHLACYPGSDGVWSNVLRAGTSRAQADEFFSIDGLARIHMGKAADRITLRPDGGNLAVQVTQGGSVMNAALFFRDGSASFTGGLRPGSYTAAQLGDAAHAVNTSGKAAGMIVWNSTEGRHLYAGGPNPGSPWKRFNDNTNAVTPA